MGVYRLEVMRRRPYTVAVLAHPPSCIRRLILLVTFVALLTGVPLRAALPDEAATLALPLSPGAIALLAQFPTSDAARVRLTEALASSRPELRAAAARVAFATANVALAPRVAAALAQETMPEALDEESRMLAFFGPADADVQLLAAWQRAAIPAIVFNLASARGPASLSLWPQLRQGKPAEWILSTFVRLASRKDAATLGGVVAGAVRDDDAELVTAALDAARESRITLPLETVPLVLRGRSSEVRTAGLWHVVREWKREEPVAPDVKAAISALADQSPEAATPALVFANELASRMIGRPARTDDAWVGLLRQPGTGLNAYFQLDALRTLLTDDERRQMAKTFDTDPARLGVGITLRAAPVLPSPAPSSIPLMNAGGYPPGFMASLFETAKCVLPKSDTTIGGGEATFRGDGRIARLTLGQDAAPDHCVDAARILLVTYVASATRLPAAGDRALLIVPFFRDYVACQNTAPQMPPQPIQALLSITGATIVPPRKISDVRPTYPLEMQRQRISGVVVVESTVTTAGCVQDVRVLRSVSPQLDWAALKAVLQWKFSPALLDGRPVPVTLSVTVNFLLN
jgi:TonB family protein